MNFGEKKIDDCLGCLLAHSFADADIRIKKGTKLNQHQIDALKSFGVKSLIVACLGDDDAHEDAAANLLGDACLSNHIRREEAFTGRVNFFAKRAGMFRASTDLVGQFNGVHPAITLATLHDQTPVEAGRMVGTLKIIPFAAPQSACDEINQMLQDEAPFSLSPFAKKRVGLISTKLPHLKQSIIDKTAKTLEKRLNLAGAELSQNLQVSHDVKAINQAIKTISDDVDLLIIFGASATIDEHDAVPQALLEAGGEVERFGMPVDPGNLLVLGAYNKIPVIGAPGCARSSAENGFDFVLYRLLSDQVVLGRDIAQMGVGGLLKEIHSRPQPRQGIKSMDVTTGDKPKIAALILAGGQSRRMGEDNKLLMPYKGLPMVAHAVEAVKNSDCVKTYMVTGHEAGAVKDALKAYDIEYAHNADFDKGLSTSIRAGVSALCAEFDAVIIMLGDMPMISSAMINQMIARFDVTAGITIVQAAQNGKGGNPVLWGAQYFEALLNLDGDIGARPLIARYESALTQVELGDAAFLDVDTKQAFEKLNKK